MANKNKIIPFTIKVNTDNGKVKIEGVTKGFQKAENAYKKLATTMKGGVVAKEIDKVADEAERLQKSTGGAAATVTEMGRAISDMPYGIRGVANNLSQLSSQFVNTMRSAGGFGAALKSMWSAMMGPLGILIAIQAGLALLEAWSMRSKEAAESFSGVFGQSITETSAKLMILRETINSTTLTLEEKQHVLSTAKEEMADLGIKVDETATSFDDLDKVLLKHIDVLTKTAIAQGFLNVFQESANKFAEEQMKTTEEALSGWDNFLIEWGGMYSYRSEINAEKDEKAQENREKNMKKHNDKMAAVFQELQKKLDDGDMYLNYLFGKEDNSGGSSRKRALKIFKAGVLDLEKLILQQQRDMTLATTRDEVEKLEIKKDFAQQDIDRQLETFEKKQQIRLDDYLKSIEGHEKEAELAADARAKHKTAMENAEVEAGEAKMAIRLNYAQKIAEKEIQIEMAIRGKATKDALKTESQLFAMLDPQAYADAGSQYALEESRMNRLQFLEDSVTEAERGGNDKEIQNAQMALNDFNQQLREEDIKNENAYYQNKKDIQMEYVGFLQQTAQLFETLAGDNEAMQKAALIMEKSAATANIIIQTQQAIASRRMGNLMLAAAGPAGVAAQKLDKLPMEKDIARAKVGAALSIANIWATGWGRNNSVKDSGSGGQGSGGRTFDFNLVGSTEQNQLAQTTAGQLDQPVQAYVVSSQITNQQQLDNQIQTDATFGD